MRYCGYFLLPVLHVTLLRKARSLLLDLALLVMVSLLVYAAAEWAFLRVFTWLFPLEAIQKFDEPDGIWPVLQSSKNGFVPHDYIAVTGDSYAMGMGDAMAAAGRHYRPRFHSAHVIQDATGRDVLSFGLPGSGSIRGMIGNPVGGLRYLQTMVAAGFPVPETVVVYFYEGNDLTENWMYFEKTFLPVHAAADYDDPAVFDDYIQQEVLGRQHLRLAANAAGWKERLFLWRYARRVFAEQVLGKKFFRRKYPGEFGMVYVPENRWQPRHSVPAINHAVVNGEVTALPDNLQGPAMDLSLQQLQHATGTFARALAWSRQNFPQARFAVVYIPSVLSTYQLAGEQVEAQNYFSDTDTRFSVAQLEQHHAWISDEIARICGEQGVPFADTTADLRQAASTRLLHGPQDWNHFSREGYEVLGQSVVRQLPMLFRQ